MSFKLIFANTNDKLQITCKKLHWTISGDKLKAIQHIAWNWEICQVSKKRTDVEWSDIVTSSAADYSNKSACDVIFK